MYSYDRTTNEKWNHLLLVFVINVYDILLRAIASKVKEKSLPRAREKLKSKRMPTHIVFRRKIYCFHFSKIRIALY